MSTFLAIVSLDNDIAQIISGLQNTFLDPLMVWFTKIGDLWAIWLIITLLLILWKKYQHEGIALLWWLAINVVLGEWILKHFFHRDRPFLVLPDIILKIPAPQTSSFPSGHTSASFCFALLFTYFFWNKSKMAVVAVWIVAIGISFSRLYLQVHYPSDVLWGIFAGTVSAVIVIWIWEKWRRKMFRSNK